MKHFYITGIILVVIILALYSSDWFVFDVVDNLNKATLNHSVVDNIRHIFLKVGDSMNPFMANYTKSPYIKHYELILSKNDLLYFKNASIESLEAGYIIDSASDYRKIQIEFKGTIHKAEMALTGDRPDNYAFNKKSFKLKTSTGRLRFTLPENRSFTVSIFQAEVSKLLGLTPLHYEMADVGINGFRQGLFLVEEPLKEYTKRTGTITAQLSDNWIEDHPIIPSTSLHWLLSGLTPPGGYDYSAGVIFETGHNTPFDLDISNFECDNKINYRLYQLLKAVEENDQNSFEDLIDVENVSSVETLRALFGNVHNFTGDNLRLFYTDENKFGFVPRFEGPIDLVEINKGGIDKYLTTFAGNTVPILEYVERNQELRHRRNEKLYRLLKNEEEILDLYKEIDSRYRPSLTTDSTITLSSREIARFLDKNLEKLEQNFKTLSNQYYYSKVYINIIKEDKVLIEVIPDSATAIKFNSFIIDGVELKYLINSKLIQPELGDEMESVRTVFSYEVDLNTVNNVVIEVKNAVTNKIILEEDVYVKIARA